MKIVFSGQYIISCVDSIEGVIYKPPIKRGDLQQLGTCSEKRGVVLILDGVFGQSLSISPLECRDCINKGWELWGASSMGALRASELYSHGMIGIGNVYNWLRVGLINSDADLAVAYNPVDYSELTISSVHIRYVIGILKKHNKIDGSFASYICDIIIKIYWLDRTLITIREKLVSVDIDENIINIIEEFLLNKKFHPKLIDARDSLELLEKINIESEPFVIERGIL